MDLIDGGLSPTLHSNKTNVPGGKIDAPFLHDMIPAEAVAAHHIR